MPPVREGARFVEPWGEHDVREGETRSLRVGPATLWMRSRADEIWLAARPGTWSAPSAAPPGAAEAPPADAEWIRWPVPDAATGISLVPAFPPRPVVVEPELSFRLLPRARARIYVRVPLWIRAEVAGVPDLRLTEVPSLVLSDTWWGAPTDGELCFWLRTHARREAPPELFEPYLVVCPLQLSNRSDDDLEVEKIALRVGRLSLFVDDGRLWADETRVRYRGADEGSDIEVSGEPPPEAPLAKRVAGPRDGAAARSFTVRTFARLKALPGLAGI